VAATDDAFDLAFKALGYKERTESELRAWLAERGVEEPEIEEVVALLAEAGAIDDASFARRYAADKQLLEGWGPDRIRKALEVRRVASEHIEAAVGGEEEAAQLGRATSLLLDRGMGLGSERERERALGLLVRRGFPLELAYEAVRAAERQARDAA
jgi:regulatory protein